MFHGYSNLHWLHCKISIAHLDYIVQFLQNRCNNYPTDAGEEEGKDEEKQYNIGSRHNLEKIK